jgi:hypothetical protein
LAAARQERKAGATIEAAGKERSVDDFTRLGDGFPHSSSLLTRLPPCAYNSRPG